MGCWGRSWSRWVGAAHQWYDNLKGEFMAKRTLTQVLEQVKALSPGEQQQLWRELHRLVTGQDPSAPEAELERRLYEAGLLSEVKPPITDLRPYEDRRPIEAKGKPLSQVIVEERR
jgi:hypothetical protein